MRTFVTVLGCFRSGVTDAVRKDKSGGVFLHNFISHLGFQRLLECPTASLQAGIVKTSL